MSGYPAWQLWLACGGCLIIGAFVGVAALAVFQINRERRYERISCNPTKIGALSNKMKIHLASNTWRTKCGKRHSLVRRDGTLKRLLPVAELITDSTCRRCPKDWHPSPPDNEA